MIIMLLSIICKEKKCFVNIELSEISGAEGWNEGSTWSQAMDYSVSFLMSDVAQNKNGVWSSLMLLLPL